MIFFKRKNTNNSEANTDDASEPTPSVDIPISDNLQTKFRRIETDEIDANSLGLRNGLRCIFFFIEEFIMVYYWLRCIKNAYYLSFSLLVFL